MTAPKLLPYVKLQGDIHKHWQNWDLVGWHEHAHAGGSIPHQHDPETGFQIPVADSPSAE